MGKKSVDWSLMGPFMIKFAYIGSEYFGLSAQNELSSSTYFECQSGKRCKKLADSETVLPTIESTIEKALQKASLIKSLVLSNCSRCGRTDRGVHARGNYLTLQLRLKTSQSSNAQAEAEVDSFLVETKNNPQYYDYAAILNGLLPAPIRVIWVRACPVYLDARFHCLHRMYKYFFPLKYDKPGRKDEGILDVDLMDMAAAQFLGSHNFKNFCKNDPSSKKTTQRQLFVCRVQAITEDVGVALVTGPAFLWHQVRCMVGCLMEIGKGNIKASSIAEWLDVEKTPQKPPYPMAEPHGLVLWDCAFEFLPSAPIRGPDQTATQARHPQKTPAGSLYRTELRELAVKKEITLALSTAFDETRPFTATH